MSKSSGVYFVNISQLVNVLSTYQVQADSPEEAGEIGLELAKSCGVRPWDVQSEKLETEIELVSVEPEIK